MDRKMTKKKWKFSSDNYPIILSKRPSKMSVGFEWEIPLDVCALGFDECQERFNEEWDMYEDIHDLDPHDIVSVETRSQLFNDLRFHNHIECGGIEVCSPVSTNIATARALARAVKDIAAQEPVLLPDEETVEGGIHVHISHNDFKDMALCQTVFDKARAMLNRHSSASFVKDLSGRDISHEYYAQVMTTDWDYGSKRLPSEVDKTLMTQQHMVFLNNPAVDTLTIEYRLWTGRREYLTLAIEFAHAVTSFVMSLKEDSSIPYLKDMREWLDKQSGYRELKARPEWSYV